MPITNSDSEQMLHIYSELVQLREALSTLANQERARRLKYLLAAVELEARNLLSPERQTKIPPE